VLTALTLPIVFREHRCPFAYDLPKLRSLASVTSDFESATGVRRRSDSVYDGEIAEGWDIGGNANGGYVMALGCRAMADAVGRPPLTVTAHFLAPGKPGPVAIHVDTIRAGRRTATVAATVRSGETTIVVLLGTFAEQEPGGPAVYRTGPPTLPPVEECVPMTPPVDAGFRHRVRAHARPIDAGFGVGRPSGTAEIEGWFELPDTDRLDAFGLMLATDAFAPVVFNSGVFPVGWSPTVELTVHIRGTPAPGPLRCRLFSTFMADGMFDETGELWDTAGTLVAQSRQLALVPRG
jgi:acyl-coenzyme A thioesterase PaaI-like protein